MAAGTIFVLIGAILALASLFDARYPLLAIGVVLIGVGVLVGAPPLDLHSGR